MTMNKIMGKLRRHNKNQYTLLGICVFLSVLLVTSFTLMYFFPHRAGAAAGGRRYQKAVMAYDGSHICGVYGFLRSTVQICFSGIRAEKSECF